MRTRLPRLAHRPRHGTGRQSTARADFSQFLTEQIRLRCALRYGKKAPQLFRGPLLQAAVRTGQREKWLYIHLCLPGTVGVP